MSWTYDTTLATDKDKVRLYIGDTDVDFQQVSDEEILALLNTQTVYQTSATIITSLISKYALRANETVGRISVQYSHIVDNLRKSLDNLNANTNGGGKIFVGGLSISGKKTYTENTDIVQPAFVRGTTDNEE